MDKTRLDAEKPLLAGILTFLLTDIEGSTRLWERYPEQMRAAMVRHDLLIENASARFDGYLILHLDPVNPDLLFCYPIFPLSSII